MAAVRVCRTDEVELKSALRVEIDDVPVAIVKDSAGVLHAVGDTCSHAEISLSEGEVDDCTIECWAHGSSFELKSGQPLALPAYEPIPVFALSIDGDDVYVDIAQVLNGVEPIN